MIVEVKDQFNAIYEKYRNLTNREINPDFILLSATVMEKSDFDAVDFYSEPIEPKIINGFDYQKFNEDTVKNAQGFIERIRSRLEKCQTIYEKIFCIMRSRYFRDGTIEQTLFDDNKEFFRQTIESHINRMTPIEIVLPSFPFKFPNPAKVLRQSPDMAEILCLSRLYEICVAIQLVYEPGARFIIIADGQVYHSMFGVTLNEAIYYRETTREMISKLKYGDKLELIDMQDLVNSKRDLYDSVNQGLRYSFKQWWNSNENDLRKASLFKASAFNINSFNDINHDLIQMVTKDILHKEDHNYLIKNFEKIRRRVYQRADEAAFEFALFPIH